MRFIDNFDTIKVWDKVIILNENSFEKLDIENQVLDILNNYKIDIFHMFLYDLYSLTFMKYISDCTKLILTEEGTMTYQPLKHYLCDKIQLKKNRDTIQNINDLEMNWDRVDEIFLFEPLLFDGSLNKPIKRIEIELLLNDYRKREDFINKLNNLFSYSLTEKKYEIIYFDSYCCDRGMISLDYERYYLSNIVNIISDYKYIIKLHPNERKDFYKVRYNDLKVNIDYNYLVPWEVIFLNIIYNNNDKKLIIISAFSSTSIYNTQIIGKYAIDNRKMKNIYTIYLTDIIKNYMPCYNLLDVDLKDITNFKKLFYENNIYVPKNFTEFYHILREIYGYTGEYTVNDETQGELSWLRSEYLRRYNFSGDTVTTTALSVSNSKSVNRSVKLYVDYSFKEFKFKFDLSKLEFYNINPLEFVWKVFDRKLYNQILISNIYCISNKDESINNSLNIMLENNMKLNEWIDISSDNTIRIILNNTYNIKYLCINFKAEGLRNYSELSQENIMLERYFQYYDLLYKWLIIKQNNRKLSEYFTKNNYMRIGIYGNGKIGKRLLQEIQKDVEMVCFITDRESSFNDNNGIEVICINDLLNSSKYIDIIVVTPIYEFEDIRKLVLSKFVNVISIKEVVNCLLNINA